MSSYNLKVDQNKMKEKVGNVVQKFNQAAEFCKGGYSAFRNGVMILKKLSDGISEENRLAVEASALVAATLGVISFAIHQVSDEADVASNDVLKENNNIAKCATTKVEALQVVQEEVETMEVINEPLTQIIPQKQETKNSIVNVKVVNHHQVKKKITPVKIVEIIEISDDEDDDEQENRSPRRKNIKMEDANKLPEKREKTNSFYAKLELDPG